jgi:hypothetical protein
MLRCTASDDVRRAVLALRDGRPPEVEPPVGRILTAIMSAAWKIAINYNDKPLSFYDSRNRTERTLAMTAVSDLALKGIEASFAKAKWHGR